MDSLWDKFIKPVAELFIDPKVIHDLYNSYDWQGAVDRLRSTHISYPDYYRLANFHGIEGGYLNLQAALTYDTIAQYFLPPNEVWVRQGLVEAIADQPKRILDLGCGTGSMTFVLKQSFPQASITGLDLSPYMLAMADYKAQNRGERLTWYHGNAEHTGFPMGYFDLVTAVLLCHETPRSAIAAILTEAFRILKPGGQILILDANQALLRRVDWLNQVFEEPYIQDYAAQDLRELLEEFNFMQVKTTDLWVVHQVSSGRKPLPVAEGWPFAGTEVNAWVTS